MKIIRETAPQNAATRTEGLDDFAARHDLTMRVTHYPKYYPGGVRFIAAFDGAWVKDGRLLCGAYGDSYSEAAAIDQYAQRISGRTLVFNDGGPNRKEIEVPILTLP